MRPSEGTDGAVALSPSGRRLTWSSTKQQELDTTEFEPKSDSVTHASHENYTNYNQTLTESAGLQQQLSAGAATSASSSVKSWDVPVKGAV